ncbi:Acyl-CoA N-acyltransferases (NAT) superfamily protein [Rhynchospora pubera]|uniref:Acyl-CoA N-acyltransferases (NAT) superfamily protein n=1 Tax=Rhynchospora pubera TaxID=906938 RepID=A0AAV8D109_9POAL|nr:Acyl-CoA N-acyltransferases (NAT) superfamily protein [Rhynchospora pubera]
MRSAPFTVTVSVSSSLPHLRPFLSPRTTIPNPNLSFRQSYTTRSDQPRISCGATQTSTNLLPSLSPEIVVREARFDDAWEVADTHCSSFYPNYTFPIDLLLRLNRFVGMVLGFSAPPGCMVSCLVAVRCHELRFWGLDAVFGFNRGYVAGVLTIDTLAEFLPRKGPFKHRRKGIAYISNVAVREGDRRKGIAKTLVAGAESLARSWGCRSIALHCDSENIAAVRLYKSQGFRCIRVPENAQWPEPRSIPGTHFNFMMKLL